MKLLICIGLLLVCHAVVAHAQEQPPREWIDPDTGHRVIRLSDEPGSQSLYFHQNPYTPDGKRMIISTPSGLSLIELATRKITPVVEGRVRLIMAGYKTGDIYYMKDRAVYRLKIDTHESQHIADLPEKGTISTVNCDETLLAGTITHYEPGSPATQPAAELTKAQRIDFRFEAHLPMELFTIEIASGKVRTFNRCNNWLNHLQFSPTDPNLLLFCHEGPWHKVNRTWLVDVSSDAPPKQLHYRTMEMEIEGHEWFSADGKTVWYDLQTPRGQVFWVAGYEIATGKRTWFNLQRNEWSVHFNSSPDGTLFAGDGGSPGMVARAPDGQWIYLFRPRMNPDRDTLREDQPLIRTGVFDAEKLVNMGRHDYKLEPNVTFTPDMKWIVFRSNMHGPSHVYAVEIEKK